VLDVYVFDVPEMSRPYRVSSTGTINFPLLAKPLFAAGLSLTQLSSNLSDELKASGVLSDPKITVSVLQSRLHSVAITGAVKRPQIYPLLGETTLLDLLSQAEGLADDAGNTAFVQRGDIATHALGLDAQGGAPAPVLAVDLKRALETGDPAANVPIYPGDRVTVPRAGIFYVVGAVNKPGGFIMRSGGRGVTVLQALALAEDLKSTAIRSKAVLIRVDTQSPDGRKQIPVDLKTVLSGKATDTVMQADDILFVPDSPGKKAFRRGMESALQMATGVAIYRF
jgi:polysaccharide biosynthesis/export protein